MSPSSRLFAALGMGVVAIYALGFVQRTPDYLDEQFCLVPASERGAGKIMLQPFER